MSHWIATEEDSVEQSALCLFSMNSFSMILDSGLTVKKDLFWAYLSIRIFSSIRETLLHIIFDSPLTEMIKVKSHSAEDIQV